VVHAGEKLDLACWIDIRNGENFHSYKGCNSVKHKDIENPDMGIFELAKSQLDRNSSDVGCG